MKTIIFISVCITLFILDGASANSVIQNGLNATTGNANSPTTLQGWEAAVGGALKYIKEVIVGLVPLIAIGTFLFIGARLFIAKWNPEEFKKALMHLVYVVIGLFFVVAAWAIISIISNVTL